jgi:hypothetical protein
MSGKDADIVLSVPLDFVVCSLLISFCQEAKLQVSASAEAAITNFCFFMIYEFF